LTSSLFVIIILVKEKKSWSPGVRESRTRRMVVERIENAFGESGYVYDLPAGSQTIQLPDCSPEPASKLALTLYTATIHPVPENFLPGQKVYGTG
jgi:hypothetical protein